MKTGSLRRKSKQILTKDPWMRGKISMGRYFAQLKDGQSVILQAEPAVHGGMYFHRFHGKIGVIEGKAGSCYHVKINDKGKEKTLIVHPVHLKTV